MEKNLYIIRGVPGSGKSTFAKSIAKPWQIFEADQFFMKHGKYDFDFTKLRLAHESCKRRVHYWMLLLKIGMGGTMNMGFLMKQFNK